MINSNDNTSFVSIIIILGYTLIQIPNLIIFIYDYLRKRCNQRDVTSPSIKRLQLNGYRKKTQVSLVALKRKDDGQSARMGRATTSLFGAEHPQRLSKERHLVTK